MDLKAMALLLNQFEQELRARGNAEHDRRLGIAAACLCDAEELIKEYLSQNKEAA